MSSGSHTSSSQTDIFAATGATDDSPVFTEICNALYERELLVLSQASAAQISYLQRRLAALPHRIQRAAHFLANHKTPLAVDSHNGTWQCKQAPKCTAHKITPEDTLTWYKDHAAYGLPVPVRLLRFDEEHIELDSIDRVQPENEMVHTNKYGWFTFDGVSQANNTDTDYTLLKPTKAVMAAACCGHRWNHKGRLAPRTLSLRELLLSTTVKWKKFTLNT